MSVDAFLSAASSQPDLNQEALKGALETVLAGGDDATVEGEQGAALKAGFEYAANILVKTLKREPSTDEKLELYAYFKQARGEVVPEPSGMFDMQGKYKYNAWKDIKHISAARAQALYIKKVNTLVESIGTK